MKSWKKPYQLKPVEVTEEVQTVDIPTVRPDHREPDVRAIRAAEAKFRRAVSDAENNHRTALLGLTDPRAVHAENNRIQEARQRARLQLSQDMKAAGA